MQNTEDTLAGKGLNIVEITSSPTREDVVEAIFITLKLPILQEKKNH